MEGGGAKFYNRIPAKQHHLSLGFRIYDSIMISAFPCLVKILKKYMDIKIPNPACDKKIEIQICITHL